MNEDDFYALNKGTEGDRNKMIKHIDYQWKTEKNQKKIISELKSGIISYKMINELTSQYRQVELIAMIFDYDLYQDDIMKLIDQEIYARLNIDNKVNILILIVKQIAKKDLMKNYDLFYDKYLTDAKKCSSSKKIQLIAYMKIYDRIHDNGHKTSDYFYESSTQEAGVINALKTEVIEALLNGGCGGWRPSATSEEQDAMRQKGRELANEQFSKLDRDSKLKLIFNPNFIISYSNSAEILEFLTENYNDILSPKEVDKERLIDSLSHGEDYLLKIIELSKNKNNATLSFTNFIDILYKNDCLLSSNTKKVILDLIDRNNRLSSNTKKVILDLLNESNHLLSSNTKKVILDLLNENGCLLSSNTKKVILDLLNENEIEKLSVIQLKKLWYITLIEDNKIYYEKIATSIKNEGFKYVCYDEWQVLLDTAEIMYQKKKPELSLLINNSPYKWKIELIQWVLSKEEMPDKIILDLIDKCLDNPEKKEQYDLKEPIEILLISILSHELYAAKYIDNIFAKKDIKQLSSLVDASSTVRYKLLDPITKLKNDDHKMELIILLLPYTHLEEKTIPLCRTLDSNHIAKLTLRMIQAGQYKSIEEIFRFNNTLEDNDMEKIIKELIHGTEATEKNRWSLLVCIIQTGALPASQFNLALRYILGEKKQITQFLQKELCHRGRYNHKVLLAKAIISVILSGNLKHDEYKTFYNMHKESFYNSEEYLNEFVQDFEQNIDREPLIFNVSNVHFLSEQCNTELTKTDNADLRKLAELIAENLQNYIPLSKIDVCLEKRKTKPIKAEELKNMDNKFIKNYEAICKINNINKYERFELTQEEDKILATSIGYIKNFIVQTTEYKQLTEEEQKSINTFFANQLSDKTDDAFKGKQSRRELGKLFELFFVKLARTETVRAINALVSIAQMNNCGAGQAQMSFVYEEFDGEEYERPILSVINEFYSSYCLPQIGIYHNKDFMHNKGGITATQEFQTTSVKKEELLNYIIIRDGAFKSDGESVSWDFLAKADAASFGEYTFKLKELFLNEHELIEFRKKKELYDKYIAGEDISKELGTITEEEIINFCKLSRKETENCLECLLVHYKICEYSDVISKERIKKFLSLLEEMRLAIESWPFKKKLENIANDSGNEEIIEAIKIEDPKNAENKIAIYDFVNLRMDESLKNHEEYENKPNFIERLIQFRTNLWHE